MTRPLAAVTDAMRDVAATGDLTRKVPVRSRAWDDEDARLLASAFNTLTESIARFQREAAQRERLSSLGRLSTVIAHEIRNPLMIIRASLSSLRRDHVTAGRRPRGGRGHRRGDHAAQPHRHRGARLRQADPLRASPRPTSTTSAARRRPRPGPATRRQRGAARSRPGHARRSSPTPSGCARRSSTSSPTPATRCSGGGAPSAEPGDDRRGGSSDPPGGVAVASRPGVIVKRATSRPGRHHHSGPRRSASAPRTWRTSSTRTSRRAARAPASGCRSPRTSSRAWAAPSP